VSVPPAEARAGEPGSQSGGALPRDKQVVGGAADFPRVAGVQPTNNVSVRALRDIKGLYVYVAIALVFKLGVGPMAL
jgi:hypothetical protein